MLLLSGPPPENLFKERVRELRFLPDGTMISILRGSGEQRAIGSAWTKAVRALVDEGKIDADTVVTLPGGPLWLTVGALLRELDPCP
jgi:hypothetical protein